ncbi:MAG: sugar phosphate isomerase/epimerase family protein [Planctomycetota bacterium]|jgi:inosose dehydratase
MADQRTTRREFLHHAVLATGAAALSSALPASTAQARSGQLHVACNSYSWSVFYRREDRNFDQSLDKGLADVAASGLDGFEPGFTDPAQVARYAPLLNKHGLQMRSVYVNSVLHESDKARDSIAGVLAIAEKAKAVGTRIIVTNPSPIAWGGAQNKTDDHLRTQATALNELGAKLKAMGLVLAYHNHDIELRQAAREFHHMMVGTDPEKVTLCLDAHWVYRGAGNSQVALFDVLKLYGPRITELHLRQSQGSVWAETFGDGDIDYRALARHVHSLGLSPHIVLEQAVEQGTPHTMKSVDAFRQSTQNVRRLFAGFAENA